MDALAPDIVDPPSSAQPLRPLRAAVLVDLVHGPEGGGHVKCWEHLAAAALGFQGKLDLTLFFMGPKPAIKPLGENVRYTYLPPVFSTERVPFLSHVPDHTDLASFHPALARRLTGFDLIHTTDAYFAYARTAMRVAAQNGIPLVTSIHTNTPHYARIFTEQTVERMFGHGLMRWVLLRGIGVQRYAERRMLRQLMLHQRACAAVLVSRPDQLVEARPRCDGRASLLRRGIDCTSFHPEKRDRAWLAQCYGVPQDRIVVLFTGRVNRGKNVMLLADRIEALLETGAPVHLFCAGEGDERARIRDRLGPNATLPGHLDSATLARVYASADLFAFPSPAEEYANVVLEALASGLPVLVARESGMGRIVAQGETGFALPLDPPAWTEHLALLVRDGLRRARMSAASRRFAETLPGWSEVLAEDLLPRWQRAVMAMRDERRRAPYPVACAAS